MMMVGRRGACRSCVSGFERVRRRYSRLEYAPVVLDDVLKPNALAGINERGTRRARDGLLALNFDCWLG